MVYTTVKVMISQGLNGNTNAPSSTPSGSPALLEEVRAVRRSTRYPYAAYPPGAVRLVEAQDERVRVLGALDGVEHEAAGRRSRASPGERARRSESAS